jgi:prophage regulatory protein
MTTTTTHDAPSHTRDPAPVLIRRDEVIARTGLARSTLYAYMHAGTFPRSLKLGAHSAAWVAAEVDAWIASRIALRPATLAA